MPFAEPNGHVVPDLASWGQAPPAGARPHQAGPGPVRPVGRRRARLRCGLPLARRKVRVKALVIVDMLDDFVTGALANPDAQQIVEPLSRLLAHARTSDDWVVVFSNDAHAPSDPELRVWGAHALADSPGAQVIPELAPQPGPHELVSPKRVYGAFEGTDLDGQLKALGVDEVVLTGQHTHICVRHSAYGALIHGYRLTVPRDGVCCFEGVDAAAALEYLVMAYGATLTDVAQLTGAVARGRPRLSVP